MNCELHMYYGRGRCPYCYGGTTHETQLKEETMIECTLQEAIKRCKENGGRFYAKSHKPDVTKWKVYNNDVVDINDCEFFNLEANDFDYTWIYEPPKESAFQKWNGSWTECHCAECIKRRKEGWNAAIDAVLYMRRPSNQSSEDPDRRIKELKEP
jgi:hypothetical protein